MSRGDGMEEPESVDPLLQGIRRRNRRILLATVLVFVLPLGFVARSCAVSASHGYQNFEHRLFDREKYEHDLTADQSATIHKALEEARAHGADFKKAWREAIDAAIAGGITGRPDLGRCPTSVYAPSKLKKDEYPYLPSWLNVAKTPADVAKAEPAIWASRDRETTNLEERARRPSTDREAERLVKEVQAFARDDAWTWDVLMIVDKRVEGSGSGKEGDFISGEVDGRAYLYDYRVRAVTCAGRAHAENSEEVHFKYTSRGLFGSGSGVLEAAAARDRALANDLTQESYRAAAEAVRFRAGPLMLQEP